MNTSTIARRFLAGWADMDWNSHMANTAYLNKVVDARVLTLTELGFPMEEWIRLHLGVVIMKDELEYKREVKLDCCRSGRQSPASRRGAAVAAQDDVAFIHKDGDCEAEAANTRL